MFKTFSQNKFILFLVAILLLSGAIVAGFYFLETSKNPKLSNNSNSSYNSANNSQSSLNSANSTQNSTISDQKTQQIPTSNPNPNTDNSTNQSNLTSNSPKIENKKITNTEFTKHFSKTDCWVSFDKKVYDMTTYLAIHPGGSAKLSRFCSKEIDPVSATHSGGPFGSVKIQDILAPFYVGELVE